MNIIDIIVKKKNKEILTYDEIKYAVDNFVSGEVKDYQMSSLLMAIVLNGMTEEEIRQLLTPRERAEGDNTSIGVENVLSRLKLNFGSRYGIRMESQPGQYTKTILTIPLMNERDG